MKNKRQLYREISLLKKINEMHREIINKLISNAIQIKPLPKGNIKERIVVFCGDNISLGKCSKVKTNYLIVLTKKFDLGSSTITIG